MSPVWNLASQGLEVVGRHPGADRGEDGASFGCEASIPAST